MHPLALAIARLALALGQRGYPVVAYATHPTHVTLAFANGFIVELALDRLADTLDAADILTRTLAAHGIAPAKPSLHRPVEVDQRTLDYWLFLRWHHARSTTNNPSSRNTR